MPNFQKSYVMNSITKVILEKFVNTSLGLLCPCHKASPFFATFTKLVRFFLTSFFFRVAFLRESQELHNLSTYQCYTITQKI